MSQTIQSKVDKINAANKGLQVAKTMRTQILAWRKEVQEIAPNYLELKIGKMNPEDVRKLLLIGISDELESADVLIKSWESDLTEMLKSVD